jgi:hypothetical protein
LRVFYRNGIPSNLDDNPDSAGFIYTMRNAGMKSAGELAV